MYVVIYKHTEVTHKFATRNMLLPDDQSKIARFVDDYFMATYTTGCVTTVSLLFLC